MSEVLAIVPARTGSKGIPNKNFKNLAGTPPWLRAVDKARMAGISQIVVTSDAKHLVGCVPDPFIWLHAPSPLHTDTCAMIDVIKDVLARIPGDSDQIVLLLQPTQPMRRVQYLHDAVSLMWRKKADSVVSVVQLPATHSPEWQAEILSNGYLCQRWADTAIRRQDLPKVYIRDGTVYAFRRSTVEKFGNIYGQRVFPLVVNPRHTCPLDTMDDWINAERRLG